MAAGSVGGRARRTYSVYGDPVNVSQRLQELSKSMKVSIVASEETWSLAGRPTSYEDRGIAQVRGRDGPLRVYTVA